MHSSAAMAMDTAAPAAETAAAEPPVNPAQPSPTTILQISPDLRLEKLTDGRNYLRNTDGSVQEITHEVYEAMVGQHYSQRDAPSSGYTGFASAKEDDSEIEWGIWTPKQLGTSEVKTGITRETQWKQSPFICQS